jgi:hypothetical protein
MPYYALYLMQTIELMAAFAPSRMSTQTQYFLILFLMIHRVAITHTLLMYEVLEGREECVRCISID